MDFLSLYVSLKLALFTTVVLMILVAPLAYFLAYSQFWGKSLLEVLVNIPMALPPTVLGFFLLIFMGPKGIGGRITEAVMGGSLLFTFAGIAAAAVIFSLPLAVQPMKAAFQKIDCRLLESAYVLGLSRFGAFIRVVIPNSLSGIIASAVLVFLHTLGAFGVLLIVGGSIPGQTKVASIAIYEAVEAMNYSKAWLMSLCFIPVSYVFLLLVNYLDKRLDGRS